MSDRADRTEVHALLTLDQMPGIGLATLRALVRAFGSATEALHAPEHAFRAVAGLLADGAARDAPRATVDAALALADRLGMELCTWTSSDYPEALRQLHDPPPVLFLRGRRELLGRASVTIVGARRATSRSRDVAERLGRALSSAGMCVVSGMALGIDGAAHRGALGAEGSTIAVLGRGADAPYPTAHGRIFREICSDGLVVSEFLPGTPPLPHHFPRRNRILAALSQAVVVVEAGPKSGSLITVDHALDLGLDVWAVPGPIDVTSCAGSNRLLLDGARPLLSVTDFAREVAGPAGNVGVRGSGGHVDAVPAGPVASVLAGLEDESLHVDELARRSGLSVAEALTLLTEMELGGLVHQMPGLRFRRVARAMVR